MKFIKYFSLAGLCAMPLVGCSDFLDVDNLSNANQEGTSFVESDPSVMRATTFDALKPIVTNIDMQDLSSDLYASWRKTDDGSFALFSFTAGDDAIQKYYTNCCKLNNFANGLIKFNGPDSKLAHEGRFLRALGYYYMTQQFGAVPYITEYIESAKTDYPRTPLDELYASVIDDLTDLYNSSLLPARDTQGNVSKQAVAALIAKYALAAGWDVDTSLNNAEAGTYTVNDSKYFTLAAQWAEKAIDGVQLTMSFEDKWSPFNQNNNEVIFCVNYKREGYPGDVATGGHSLQNSYKGDYKSPALSGQKGDSSGGPNMPSEKSAALFEKDDTRYDATFMTTMYNSKMKDGMAAWGTQGYYAYYNCDAATLADMPIAAKFFPSYTTEAEAEAWLAAHQTQTVLYPEGEYGNDQPAAAIMDPNGVTKYTFKTDGSWTKSKFQFKAFCSGAGSFNAPAVKKFDDPESSNAVKDNDYRNIVILHVSQMYLVAAEAYLMAGQQTPALAKINDVRRRAGAPQLGSFADYDSHVEYSYPSTFGNIRDIDLILDERARELYAERTRYEDLRRTKQLVRYNLAFARGVVSVAQMSNAAGEIKWYRPIPQIEINTNNGISEEDQNPGF